ncbi:NAD(P)-binding Rossmann-fold superfamily protein [Prunus dulcis]|uniref:NAD(P)-binding Rossmann-fold superfamily protein n=1 Tax=Prunus dulcis TaxID=3755 RepID=A0A4Y1RZ94_PRUDU|nr:NAD(P)-binding Rossmann-fold superfamily protein [Prunus dulcis]
MQRANKLYEYRKYTISECNPIISKPLKYKNPKTIVRKKLSKSSSMMWLMYVPRNIPPMAAQITSTEAQNSSSSSSSLPLNGRVAIVTGGSRGIGRAIATHLHGLGAKLVINYASSNSTQADQLASELNSCENTQSKAIAVRADVSDPEQSRARIRDPSPHRRELRRNFGPKYPTLAETSVEDWDKTFSVNARGAFLVSREAARRLRRGGGGRIIAISTSLVGGLMPGYGAYAASKAAAETMTKILAKELKGSGITANCVAPGPVATELFFAGKSEETVKKIAEACPLNRLGEPKDVAQVVGFLAGDAAEWVNGQVIRVNGGYVI